MPLRTVCLSLPWDTKLHDNKQHTSQQRLVLKHHSTRWPSGQHIHNNTCISTSLPAATVLLFTVRGQHLERQRTCSRAATTTPPGSTFSSLTDKASATPGLNTPHALLGCVGWDASSHTHTTATLLYRCVVPHTEQRQPTCKRTCCPGLSAVRAPRRWPSQVLSPHTSAHAKHTSAAVLHPRERMGQHCTALRLPQHMHKHCTALHLPQHTAQHALSCISLSASA